MHDAPAGQHVSPLKPSPPHCVHISVGQPPSAAPTSATAAASPAGTHWLNSFERSTHEEPPGQHVRPLKCAPPHGAHGRFRQSGTHCEKSGPRETQLVSSGQHVGPEKPLPPHSSTARWRTARRAAGPVPLLLRGCHHQGAPPPLKTL